MKSEIGLLGEWRPTNDNGDPTNKSYHISSLYSPDGAYDWEHYVKEYLKVCPPNGSIDLKGYRTFYNTTLGLPWEHINREVKASKLSHNTREYKTGVIPNQLSIDDHNGPIMLLTCAIDIGGKVDDTRLDYEIVAWSENKDVSYSIDHGSIGTFVFRESTLKNRKDRVKWSLKTNHPHSVWPELEKLLDTTFITDDGKQMKIQFAGIDVGSGIHQPYALDFINRYNAHSRKLIPIKGDKEDSFKALNRDMSYYRKGKVNDLYLIDVNGIKDLLSSLIDLDWDGESMQTMGFMNFPTPEEQKYTMKSFFAHYESEQRKLDATGTKYKWDKKGISYENHFWDIRVYNYVLMQIIATEVCKSSRLDFSWGNYCDIIRSYQ